MPLPWVIVLVVAGVVVVANAVAVSFLLVRYRRERRATRRDGSLRLVRPTERTDESDAA